MTTHNPDKGAPARRAARLTGGFALAGAPAMAALLLVAAPGQARAAAAPALSGTTLSAFTMGDLVISVYGQGSAADVASGTTYGDNQASPITLEEVTTTGTSVGQLVLPEVSSGTNNAISGEYGSSSEGSLSLSADGKSLVIAGYGVNAKTFNAGGNAVYGTTALAQTTSLSNATGVAVVPRVIADITGNGVVDTSTALYNVFNTNNARSVATVNGSSFYISGQGVALDTTEGLFLAQDGASSATAINTATDTRAVEIGPNGQLYISTDTKAGSGQFANISSVGTPGTLPTSASSLNILPGISSGSKKSATPAVSPWATTTATPST